MPRATLCVRLCWTITIYYHFNGMAVNFLKEPHRGFERTAIISNSDHLPVEPKTTELVITDVDNRSNECKHFTIRGYVADVRKRDAKSCFPFLLPNCASPEHASVYPPLPVAKFRRWDCRNCVYEILYTSGQRDTGGFISMHNINVKGNSSLLMRKDTETCHLEARKVFSRLPQNLNENYLKEKPEVNDCSVNISRVEKKGNEWLRKDLIKEGARKYVDGRDSHAHVQNAIKVNCLSYGCKAVNKRRGKYRNYIGTQKLRAAYVKETLKAALIKHKRTKLRKVSHSKMLDKDATSIRINFRLCCSKEARGPERKRERKKTSSNVRHGHVKKDMNAKKKDVLDADPAHTCCLGICCQEKRARGISVNGSMFMGMTDCKRQVENEVKNIHIKKIRKVRLLDDIIRSEKQQTTGSRQMLNKDTRAISQHVLHHRSQDTHTGNVSNYARGKTEIPNYLGEDEVEGDTTTDLNQRNNLVHQKSQLISVKGKDIYENHSVVQRPLLMHLVNNVENTYKGEETKFINCISLLSNFSADLPGRKGEDLKVRDSEMRVGKQKSILKRKQNLGLNGGQVASTIVIREEMKSNQFSSQNIRPNKAGNSDKRQKTSDRTGEDTILHSVGSHSDHANICQDKDSSSQKKTFLEVWENVSKKPRSKRSTEQETLDDIPMDIVELLARNQHERFQFVAETDSTNKFKFPRKADNINCNVDLDTSRISRRSIDVDQGGLSYQKFQISDKDFNDWTSFHYNGETESERKDCSCFSNANKTIRFDLDEHHCHSLTGGAAFYKNDNKSCHHPNFSSYRSDNMYSLQSCLKDRTTPCECFFKVPHHDLQQHRNGTSFGVGNHFFNNFNASVPERNLLMLSHFVDYENQRNLIGKLHYWDSSQTVPNSSSLVDLGNGCHTSNGQADLYNNETISALNLLRLMDQAACSSESHPHFQNCSEFIKETDVCANSQYNDSQLENGRRENQTCFCQLEIVNPTRKKSRDSCLLVRPFPRVGSLGPSLQKEIFSYSNFSPIPTRNSHGFVKTDANEKLEPKLNPNTSVCNAHNSFVRCKCSEKNCLNIYADRCSTSNTQCSCTKTGAIRAAELINKVNDLPLESFYKMGICVVNRNPAEFTVLDENNGYMIEIKELKVNSLLPSLRGTLHGQKKQRVMKLNDLKAFEMG